MFDNKIADLCRFCGSALYETAPYRYVCLKLYLGESLCYDYVPLKEEVKPSVGFEVEFNPYWDLNEVIWGDGTRDARGSVGGSDKQDCIQCESVNCKIPVYNEKYHIKISRLASDWDKDNPVIGSGSFDSECQCSYAS